MGATLSAAQSGAAGFRGQPGTFMAGRTTSFDYVRRGREPVLHHCPAGLARIMKVRDGSVTVDDRAGDPTC
jgi:hypothetical protein